MEKKFVIAILVENQPSVLTRVSGMFTRRAFNIDSLTVGETEDPNYSRITIHASGDDSTRKQVMKQLRKLYNVKEVKVMEHTKSVYRELALIKLKNDPSTRQEVLSAVDIFRSKIEAFIALVKPLGILEMCRTGVVALERGSEFLNSDTCVK